MRLAWGWAVPRLARRCAGSMASRRPLGMSWLGGLFLLALIGLVVFAYSLRNHEQRQRARSLRAAMQDPRTMLERFFVLRGQNYALRDAGWKELLDFMADDDRQWFERNLLRLAAMTDEMTGAVAMAVTENERRYAATKLLLNFSLSADRPIVSTIEHGRTTHAVAFIHSPGQIETLRPIFLVQESGLWKIRRFLGMRDAPHIVGGLARDKRANDEPLDTDEQMYLDDPPSWPKRKLAQLYEQAGVTPPGGGE